DVGHGDDGGVVLAVDGDVEAVGLLGVLAGRGVERDRVGHALVAIEEVEGAAVVADLAGRRINADRARSGGRRSRPVGARRARDRAGARHVVNRRRGVLGVGVVFLDLGGDQKRGLFPYATLFRSDVGHGDDGGVVLAVDGDV